MISPALILITSRSLDDKVTLATRMMIITLTLTMFSEMTCLKCVHSLILSHTYGANLVTCKINAGIVRDLAIGIAQTSPTAFILVISNPVNSTVPIVAEVLRKHGVFDPKRYYRTPTLKHMDRPLRVLTLVSGSLASLPWTSSVLLLLSLRSSGTSL